MTDELIPGPRWVLTHPGDEPEGRDVRYTPAWCTEALIAECPPPRGERIVDPCGGDGAILRVLRDAGYTNLTWYDIAPRPSLYEFPGAHADWLASSTPRPEGAAIVTNPPYSFGALFMRRCLETRPTYCAALLRLNHLGSATWSRFWREYPVTGLLILGSRRPSFSADGKTDASEYVWCVWSDGPQWIKVV